MAVHGLLCNVKNVDPFIFEWPLLAAVSTTLEIKLSLRRLDELSVEIIENLLKNVMHQEIV